jgi:hypothetical protein
VGAASQCFQNVVLDLFKSNGKLSTDSYAYLAHWIKLSSTYVFWNQYLALLKGDLLRHLCFSPTASTMQEMLGVSEIQFFFWGSMPLDSPRIVTHKLFSCPPPPQKRSKLSKVMQLAIHYAWVNSWSNYPPRTPPGICLIDSSLGSGICLSCTCTGAGYCYSR